MAQPPYVTVTVNLSRPAAKALLAYLAPKAAYTDLGMAAHTVCKAIREALQ